MKNKYRLLLIGLLAAIFSVGYVTAQAGTHSPKIDKSACISAHSFATVDVAAPIVPFQHFAVLGTAWLPEYQAKEYPPVRNVPNYKIVTKRQCNYDGCYRRTE